MSERPSFETGIVTKVYGSGSFADVLVGDRRDENGNPCPWGHIPMAGSPAYLGQQRIVGPLAQSWKAPVSPAPSGETASGSRVDAESIVEGVPVDWPLSSDAFPWRSPFASTDVGWRAWELDADWVIQGPIGAPIGYTIGGTGYIAWYDAGYVYCHLASTGEEAWTPHGIALASPVLVYNPDREELVAADLSNGQVTVIDPETGLNVAGPTVLADLVGHAFGLHGDVIVANVSDLDTALGPRWRRYVRDGSNASSYTASSYTSRCFVASGTHSAGGTAGLLVNPDGKFPVAVSSQRSVGGFPMASYTEAALFLVDMATGSVQKVRSVTPSAANFQGGGNEGALAGITLSGMGSDGHLVATRIDRPIGPGTTDTDWATLYTVAGAVLWEEDLANLNTGGNFWIWQETLGSRSQVLSDNLDVLRVMRRGSADWTLAWNGLMAFVFAAEDADGTDGWILIDDGLGTDESKKFRALSDGRVLGVWRGGSIAMASHGYLYSLEGTDLRRWAAI